jgi:hypothetical protein
MGATYVEDIPLTWKRFLMAIAVGKAAIGGAGLALAILGAYNVAAAISAADWLHGVQHAYALDTFAAAGGVTGAIIKMVFK